jgi:hypothetical protein
MKINKKLLALAVVSGILLSSFTSKASTQQPSENMNLPLFANTRGYRNRNPLNLKRPPKAQFQGTKSYDDQNHVIFIDMKYGIRAALVDLRTKHKRGLNTIDKIIRVWATGNQAQYITYLVSKTGFGANDVLIYDKETYRKLVYWMAGFESVFGITAEDYNEAWTMAGNK